MSSTERDWMEPFLSCRERRRWTVWDVDSGTCAKVAPLFWRHLGWDKKIIPRSERPSGSRKRCSETDCLDPHTEIDLWQVSQWLPRHCCCLRVHVSLCVERSILVCADNATCVWVWGISCLRVRWEGGWAILCMSDTPLYTHPSCTLLQALHFTPRQKNKKQRKRSFYTSNLNILCRGKKSNPLPTLILLFLLICDSLCPCLPSVMTAFL